MCLSSAISILNCFIVNLFLMDIDFNQYKKAFQRYWWLIPAMTLISLGFGLGYSMTQTPMYEADMSLVIGPKGIDDPRDLVDSLGTLARTSGVSITACRILDSPAVQQEAARSLAIPAEIANEYETNCVVLPDSTVLQLRVEGESPTLAADYANAIGVQGAVYINELYDVLRLRPLALAESDPTPISPDHATNVMLSGIIGLIGGIGFIVLRETLMQLWGAYGSSDASDQDDSTVAIFTLEPTADTLAAVQGSGLSVMEVETLFTPQVQLFLQQSSGEGAVVLYAGKWQYLVLMPMMDKTATEPIMVSLVNVLQTKIFTVPDIEIPMLFSGIVGVGENQNDLEQWRELLRQNWELAQRAEVRGTWKIYMD